MSETRTVYIVRGWAMGEREYTSRKQAEAFAAEVDGTVIRRTITEEEVGLNWRGFGLCDGDQHVRASISWTWNEPGTHNWGAHHFGALVGRHATQADARAAVEAAVRETWI